MLYSIFKPIIKLALHTYFKRIDVVNRERLDEERVIYVCNHPSALFDPIMVASHSSKSVYFLAGAEWFGGKLRSWLFRNEFNMIPVYRPWLTKEGETPPSNDEMFQACYEALKAGKRIIIFPEASSITVPWIRSIKTGAARIKLGADEFIGDGNEVKVIPVGLNYTNPHRFQTSALIKVGEPVDFGDLTTRTDLREEARVQQMTRRIRNAMSETVYYPEDEKNFEFIRNVKKLMSDVVKKELELRTSDLEKEFELRKEVVRTVLEYRKNKPNEILDIETRLKAYIRWFESYGFRKYNPFEEKPAMFLLKILGLILCLPLFIIGNVFNLLPFLLTQVAYNRLFRDKVKDKDAQGQLNSAFAGTMGFGVGFVLFLVWYIALWYAVSYFMPGYAAFLLTIGLGYFSGRFSLYYFKWFVQCRKYLRWKWLKMRYPDQMGALLRTREVLIKSLLALHKEQSDSKNA